MFFMILTGLFAGIMSGVFGIGGGVIIVPILLGVFKMHYHTAIGTSLVALLLPVGFFGALQYFRSGKIGWPEVTSGLLIATGMFLGAFLGAKLAISIPEVYLKKGFAIFLIMLAGRVWFFS